MALEVARYQFQSWARKGISAQISQQDMLGDPTLPLPADERASVPIGVSINASPQSPKPFALIGPGDVIGIHRDMIVRTEPRNWITNFEPNYLAFIEFYDEDFPWRYTPARPDGERLRPWLQLLVLEEGEYERDDRRVPLPVVTVTRKQALPPCDETWLFAHVHTEQDIGAGELSDLEAYLNSLREAVTTDPDKIYSRLLSPRHLASNRSYQAFLVPAFEAGRLAGLGKDPAGIPAQKPSWDKDTEGVELPFYFDWSFSTADNADFESLVELLEPRILDARIGIRSMDCSAPGFVLVDEEGRARLTPGGEQQELPAPLPEIQGLEGALKTDRTKSRPPAFTPNALQDELELLVNLPETIVASPAPPGSDEEFLNDPVVTLPFYGQNHARQHPTDELLLDTGQEGWYHDLNRDPRHRVPAAFGTAVIQKHQESLMQRAWQQVEKVYEANRAIRQAQFILQVSKRQFVGFFEQLAPANLIALTAPLHAKILGSPTTIRQQLSESRLAIPLFTAPFRRMARPAGKLVRRFADGKAPNLAEIAIAVNDGRISPALPREVPKDLPSLDGLAAQIQPRSFPAWLIWLMRNRLAALLVIIALLVAILLLFPLSGAALLAAGAGAAAAIGGFLWLGAQARRRDAAAALVDPERAVEALNEVPARPDFTFTPDLSEPPTEPAAFATVRTIEPSPTPANAPPPAAPRPSAGADSVDAGNFRMAALELSRRAAIRVPESPAPKAFDLANGAAKLSRAINPSVSFPRRTGALLTLPGLELDTPEKIVDVVAHPDFEDAMYAQLRDISKELLIPNLHLIPPNTISLLETNPKFIESYMVGLNHEMGRELLWREYPTDLRGSYFRQFWEVKGISNPDTPTDAERLKDITRIHGWTQSSRLGAHKLPPAPNADVQPGQKQVVLVVRGELLKRYPNTVIYAQKAIDAGAGNKGVRETDLTEHQFDVDLKFPLFSAEIDPDLRFFGFDLTTEKAKGAQDSNDFPGDRLGWFFVIQEVPGEPRFGMDVAYNSTPNATPTTADDLDNWDNLAWDRFGPVQPAFVTRFPAPTFPRPNQAELNQHPWAQSSAQMAYALFQSPVMVAIHAEEMLELANA